ncbi:MAG TPA: M1 family aminopeptidase [Ideonella sp.]|uniref:ABC transporter permease/M1 family aminopeptidase n=1 Tax=Ideonella sp. TaxID=1929293 RepID=UPI002C0AEF9B|nr:M1 family aminopeptidase [Ideonella sp.]HSI49737.1 M1 family aminopeptidase [Ideonella sp.]
MSARMFAPVAAFEWRYQLRSPVFWVGCLIFFLLTFGATTVDQIQIGSRGNVNINSPYAILQTLSIMNVFAVFIVVAMVAGTVLRDDETGFAPILRSTRVGKGAYLTGRFTGAVAAALLVLAAVPLAIAVGSAMPWLDAEKIGPFVPGDYLYALFVFGLPTLLITGAAFFALATATRSMMWTYVGAVTLLVLFFVTRGLLRDVQHDTLAALSDPFGLTALRIVTKYWTAAERNTRLPEITGLLLANRVLWTGIALALFAGAWWRFRFEVRGSKAAPKPARAGTAPVARSGPLPMPRSDAATRRAQFAALARFDMAFVFRSPTFFVLLFIGVINAAGTAWYTGEWYGASNIPVTRLMVQALQGAFTLMPVIIAIYYGGELVWRDRERRMHEIVDATAAPDWAHLVPKIAAIALVLVASSLVAVLTGMLVQLLKGYTHFQLGAYLLWFVWPTVVGALQLAVLSVFVQVLVPQKFIGWGLMLLYLVANVALASAGFEHNLYNYGGTPPVPLSDMNGMARFWIGQSWFHLYWSAFATLLAVCAHAFWRRGVVSPLRLRLPGARQRLRGGALAIGGAALATFVASGAFIFWNTNILNEYMPAPEREASLAEAERQLLPFEKLPMPRVTTVTLDVQLYPKETKAVTSGSYRIENRSGQPISELHLSWAKPMQLDEVTLPGASLQKEYAQWSYRIYRLQPAMQPGEVRTLAFKTTLQQRGFSNGAPLTRLVDNGSFIENSAISPSIGINRDDFLKDRAKRRKHGLPADLRPPTLEDEAGRAHSLLRADSDWVDADITVTTDADQVPIAPGYTLSDTMANGRRSAHFKPDAPINHFFSIQSGRYAVTTDALSVAGRKIALAVYHQPEHAYNVPRMLAAMKSSLTLFSEKFSPYQFRQARILEFPSYADFAQSFANTIPYSENLGFLTKLGDEDKIDVVTYVTAHEIAHQWWGHQLVPSSQQGGTMLVESFAQYSALLVMERLYGKEQMRRFLKYELDRYLRSRGGEVVEELPLDRVENQPYIHYQKGSLAMYWLKEVVGEDVVNRAMAALLKQHAFKPAPYANSLDFLRILRAEAGPQHQQLITDLFEKITLLDVKASQAKAVRRADGKYEVSFVVEAKKFYADGKGKETEAPLAEPFDIGVFSAEPGRPGYTAKSVLSFAQQAIHTGRQTVTVVVDQAPAWVGVDPYNKRIDRNSEDNLSRIESP